jgi:ubiquinone/menaquinone biosynthesis C-methylase UbiE
MRLPIVINPIKKIQKVICDSAYSHPTSRFVSIKQIIERVVPSEKLSGNCLDVGCGSCVSSLVFSSCFSEMVYVDVEKWMIERGIGKCGKEVVAHFVVSDAQQLPFKESSFDIITSFSLVEHLSDQEGFLHEVSRLLRKNGIFIMQIPNRNFFVELHTSFPFPALVPKKIWSAHCKYVLKIGDFQVKNLTRDEVAALCKPVFSYFYTLECNYSKENVPPYFRSLYGLLGETGILRAFPIGWIVFCIKK